MINFSFIFCFFFHFYIIKKRKPSLLFVTSFVYAILFSNYFFWKILPNIIQYYINGKKLLLIIKIICISLDVIITLLFILIIKKLKYTLYLMKISTQLITCNDTAVYGYYGSLTSFIYHYGFVYTLYGFVSKFNHTDDPNEITFGRISLLFFIIFICIYYHYRFDYTIRSGISESIYLDYINCNKYIKDTNGDNGNFSMSHIVLYMDDINSKYGDKRKYLEAKKKLNFYVTKFTDSVSTGAFLKAISKVFDILLIIIRIICWVPLILKNIYVKIFNYYKSHCNICNPILLIIIIAFAPLFAVGLIMEKLINLIEYFHVENGDYIAVLIGMNNCSFKEAAKKKNAILEDREIERFFKYIKFITTFCFAIIKYSVLVVALYVVILFSTKVYKDDFNTTYQGIFSSIFVLIYTFCKNQYNYLLIIPTEVTMQTLLFCSIHFNQEEEGNNNYIENENVLKDIYKKLKENATGDIMDYILDWIGDCVEEGTANIK